MFLHSLKYALKAMIKNKTSLIWTLAFPIALGTFMYMSFGNIFETDAMFHTIPVAVVEKVDNKNLMSVLESLSQDGEEQLLDIKVMEEEEANSALESKEVLAIVNVDEEVSMVVAEQSYSNTVLKSVLEEYKRVESLIGDIAVVNIDEVNEAIENISAEKQFYTEKTTSDGSQSGFNNFFYAVFAMSCLFASFASAERIRTIQANTSPLGMRRSLSPNSKMITILAEFTSMLLVQFVIEIITLIYMSVIGVDFGGKYLQIAVVLFFGACIGIAQGIIIGSISKLSESMIQGICISISMGMSVLADLVANGVKDMIEHTVPIINRINPAALIVDSFYALSVYENDNRYLMNVFLLGSMSAGLLVISFFMLRRNKYASL